MTKNAGQPEYDSYSFKGLEAGLLLIRMLGTVGLFTLFFYRSIWALLVLWPIGWGVWKKEEQKAVSKQKRELNRQFMECIMAVSVNMQAGYSAENAFLESARDMESFFGKESLIYRELETMRRGFVLHTTLEELLYDLAQRSGSEDIKQFAQVFAIAKKRGGDMTHVISDTVERIREKVELQEEIRVILSGKEMEQNIMRMMPFGILLYIGVTYPGYFDSFYHNLTGIALMTVAMGMYLGAFVLGDFILRNIEKEMTNMSQIKPEKPICRKQNRVRKHTDRLTQRIPFLLRCSISVQRDLEQLYPEEDKQTRNLEYCLGRWEKSCFITAAVLFLGLLYWLQNHGQNRFAAGVSWIVMASLGIGIFCYFLADKDLADRAKKKRQSMWRQYPDLVRKMILLMGAGLSIRGCFQLLAEEYECVLFAWRDFQAGLPEQTVFDRFGRRLRIREYIRLGTLLAQNARRGNQMLLERLEEEALHISRTRQQETRILGEKAQTKLLLPMVCMLLVVMLFIMIPAFIEM